MSDRQLRDLLEEALPEVPAEKGTVITVTGGEVRIEVGHSAVAKRPNLKLYNLRALGLNILKIGFVGGLLIEPQNLIGENIWLDPWMYDPPELGEPDRGREHEPEPVQIDINPGLVFAG